MYYVEVCRYRSSVGSMDRVGSARCEMIFHGDRSHEMLRWRPDVEKEEQVSALPSLARRKS